MKRPMRGEGATLAAIEALYEANFRRYVRVAEAITGSPDAAVDAVQEAFARVVGNRQSFRGDAALGTWVWRSVINAARSQSLGERVPGTAVAAETPFSPGPDAIELRGFIARLPERQRIVVFLRYFADADYQRISDILGIEIGTVGATLSTAHATLRRRLEEVAK